MKTTSLANKGMVLQLTDLRLHGDDNHIALFDNLTRG
jgi:hypothetical protein